MGNSQKITMAHGSGGSATRKLIQDLFHKYFQNDVLDKMEDAAVLDIPSGKIAYTTDSFVVTPIFFQGGDIGKLAVCGTLNDLLVMGAEPKYLSVGFILEEGMDIRDLEEIIKSMALTAEESGVKIVAGDTKVIEGSGGIYINTSGIGLINHKPFHTSNVKPGDAVIVSGSLGNHHACILSHRMNIKNTISSDCAYLGEMVQNLIKANIEIKAMRDVTRGGLATVLNEIAESSNTTINLKEGSIPVDPEVKSFCDILGLDPLYMANEGKIVCFVSREDAEKALSIIKNSRFGEKAAIIAEVSERENVAVTVTTRIGGKRILNVLQGEGLPRIC
ncbi:hydrogenase expression/formation protein HypE [Acetivibrio clariflavus DSM 19732]|uniref:Hydrogenase expression/formation protein HypE n=2 Tax=Acetivibrio clariflavus TaxID=288965 RepID=G8LX13_ACECE|nr:hydrogenase expression/formation protein HypE [Acetivibrio clariflavus DSM 19732]